MKTSCFFVIIALLIAAPILGQEIIKQNNYISGKGFTTEQYSEIQTILEQIQTESFSGSSFDIVEGTWYEFDDEIGQAKVDAQWEQLIDENQSRPNRIIIGRGSPGTRTRYKLDLKINVRDLGCYDEEFQSILEERVPIIQRELEDWSEYLLFANTNSEFDVYKQVVELLSVKLLNICCIGSSERFCSVVEDGQQILKRQNLYYSILGELKCILESSDESLIEVPSNSLINGLTSSDFPENISSKMKRSNHIDRLGSVHIYPVSQSMNEPIKKFPDIKISTRSVEVESTSFTGNHSYWNFEPRNVLEIDVGRFYIIIYRFDIQTFDLYYELEKINAELESSLGEIVTTFLVDDEDAKDITAEQAELFKYASYCNFDCFGDNSLNKIGMLKLLISGKRYKWYNYHKTSFRLLDFPLLINSMLQSLSEAEWILLLQDMRDDGGFAHDFVTFNYGDDDIKSSVMDHIITVYREKCIQLGFASNSIFDEQVLEQYSIPVKLGSSFGFLTTDFDFEYDKNEHIITVSGPGSEKWPSLHPMDLVFLPHLDLTQIGQLNYYVVPAVMMVDFTNIVNRHNLIESAVLTADVASIFIGGIGLYRAAAKGAYKTVTLHSVEILATTCNNAVSRLKLLPEDKRGPVIIALSMIEVASGMGSLSAADFKKIQNKADDALRVIDDVHGVDEIKLVLKLVVGSRTALLARMEGLSLKSSELYKIVEALPEESVAIERLSSFEDDALIATKEYNVAKSSALINNLTGVNGSGLAAFMRVGESNVNAWSRANRVFSANSKFVTDVPTLEGILRLSLEGSVFRNRIGANWEIDLDAILKFARESRCSTCGNSGRVGRSSMEQYLDDVDYFIANFSVTSGGKGETFFNWMRGRTNGGSASVTNINSISTQLDELHQTIRDLTKRGLNDSSVVGMGEKFDLGKPGVPAYQFKEYDLRLPGNRYIEYKNANFVDNPLKNRSQSIDQFINGYLRNIESFSKFEWKAGYDKLKTGWGSLDNALTEMKSQWKTVFENNFDDIFDVIWDNQSLKSSLFDSDLSKVEAKLEFADMVAVQDNALYKFIKVE